MKKIIALLLSILMVCSLAACASKQDTAVRNRNRIHRDGCKQQRREDAYHGDERCLPAV